MPTLEMIPSPLDGLRTMHRRGGQAGPIPLPSALSDMLNGTKGFALDPLDPAMMHQDAARSVPVTTGGQMVGNIRTKGGTVAYDFSQAVDSQKPLWDGGGGLTFDGSNDRLIMENTGLVRNTPAAYCQFRTSVAVVAASTFFELSGVLLTSTRLRAISTGTGVLTVTAARNDATANRVLNSAGGTVTAADHTFAALADYAGANQLRRFVANVDTGGTALNGTAANSEDADSTIFTLGCNGAQSGSFLNGKIGRMVFLPFVPTAGQRTTIEDWLNAATL
jgi:hypothetical protein